MTYDDEKATRVKSIVAHALTNDPDNPVNSHKGNFEDLELDSLSSLVVAAEIDDLLDVHIPHYTPTVRDVLDWVVPRMK